MLGNTEGVEMISPREEEAQISEMQRRQYDTTRLVIEVPALEPKG